MKTKLFLCSVLVTLLAPGISRGEDPKPAPDRGDRPNWEQLREEMRNLTPEERQARLRELREQFGAREGASGEARPNMDQLREQFRNLPPEEREQRLRQMREQFRQRAGQPAQPSSGAPSARGNPMMGQMGAGMDRVFAVLTPEQRQSLREGAERNREEVRLLEEKLRAARKAAMEAGIEPNFDEAELRQKLRVVADLDADLTVLRAHALANVEPPLSAEQIEKLKNPAPLGEMQRDRRPDALQPRPPGNFPPREPLPQGDRPIRRGPPEGQRPPPDQF